MDKTPVEELFAFGVTEQYRVPVSLYVREDSRTECGTALVVWCQGRQILVMEEDDYSQIQEIVLQSPDYAKTTRFVKKEVPGSEEIQKMGDEILTKATKASRMSEQIRVGREIAQQLKQHGLQMTMIDGHPVVTKIEE